MTDVSSLPLFDPGPVVLEGAIVRLEPLTTAHLPALIDAGADPAVWKWTSIWPTPESGGTRPFLERWVADAIALAERGEAVPWATIDKRSGRCIGSTRFLNIRRDHRGLEIGWTWLSPQAQRSGVNTEAKLLQIAHAFDTLGAIRVEWRTDERNAKSRAAIERLGAKHEGIIRAHVIRQNHELRNTAVFAATRDDWPGMRARLEGYLATHRAR